MSAASGQTVIGLEASSLVFKKQTEFKRRNQRREAKGTEWEESGGAAARRRLQVGRVPRPRRGAPDNGRIALSQAIISPSSSASLKTPRMFLRGVHKSRRLTSRGRARRGEGRPAIAGKPLSLPRMTNQTMPSTSTNETRNRSMEWQRAIAYAAAPRRLQVGDCRGARRGSPPHPARTSLALPLLSFPKF